MPRRRNGRDERKGSGPLPLDYYTMVDPKQVAQGECDPNLFHDILSELYDLDIMGAQLHGIGARVYEELRPAYPKLKPHKLYEILRLLIGETKQSSRQSKQPEVSLEEQAIPSPSDSPTPRMSGRPLVVINHWPR